MIPIDFFQASSKFKNNQDSLSHSIIYSSIGPSKLGPPLSASQTEQISSILSSSDAQQQPNIHAIIDEYLALLQSSLSPASYSMFLKVLGIYLKGSISHCSFIRLFFHIVSEISVPNDQIHFYLPQFLSAVNAGSFFPIPVGHTTDFDSLRSIAIIESTSSLQSAEAGKSLYKCFYLLSIQAIDLPNARAWAKAICKKDVLADFDSSCDLSVFNPDLFDPSFILSNFFPSKPMTVKGDAKDEGFRTYLFDLFRSQMLGYTRSLKAISLKTPPSILLVGPLFGSESSQIIKSWPKNLHAVVQRIGEEYAKSRTYSREIMLLALRNVKPSEPEFRICYKKLIRKHLLSEFLSLPGIYQMDFNSPASMQAATALIINFARELYEGEELSEIRKGLRMVSPLIIQQKTPQPISVFYVKTPHLDFLSLLGELELQICKEFKEDLPKLEEDSFGLPEIRDGPPNLLSIPSASKQVKGLSKLFSSALQHVDLVLLRCLRALKKISRLPSLSSTSSSDFYSTKVTRVNANFTRLAVVTDISEKAKADIQNFTR